MPPQGRVRDRSEVPADTHGALCCPHHCIGEAVAGSPDVKVNGQPALRVTDPGKHQKCCQSNKWQAIKGSGTVFIINLAAHRKGDQTAHCGGLGKLIEGSPNVVTGG